jgi:hypothetical protein
MEEQRGAPTATRHTVLVHRQAIYTPQLEVMAYLLDCQRRVPEPGGEPASHTLAPGLLTSVLDIGLEALVACATFLTLTVAAEAYTAVAVQAARLHRYARPLVALQVPTWTALRDCRTLGFAYVHGPFSCQPVPVTRPCLPTNRLVLVRLLVQLQHPLSTVTTLADLISQDVVLSHDAPAEREA